MSPEEANKIVAAFSQSREAGMKALGEYHASPAETSAPGAWEISGDRMSVFVGNKFLFTGREATGIVEVLQTVEEHNAALATLRQQLAQAMELLREIRDGEVNEQDEADKFLRDHIPSELSKTRLDLSAAQAACKAKDEALAGLLQTANRCIDEELNQSIWAVPIKTVIEKTLAIQP